MSAKPKKPAPSLAATARETGIARETLRSWKAQGIDIFNRAELLKRAEARRSSTSGNLGDLKAEKIQLECERLRAAIDREAGLYLLKSEVEKEGVMLGTILRSHLKNAAGNLPSMVCGLDSPKIHRILVREFDNILESLHHHADHLPHENI